MSLKNIWYVCYIGEDGKQTAKEYICNDFETLVTILKQRVWCSTITSVELSRQIEEVL